MGKTEYTHKTSQAQLEQFKSESKNGGELLHKVFMNEIGRGIPYPMFLSELNKWLKLVQRTDIRTGVATINKYLDKTLV